MEFTLFDPTIPTRPETIKYTSRPKRLDKLKIAIVENTKHNSKTILLKIFERFERKYQTELAGVFRKQSAGHPISDPDIETCSQIADIAIAGIGD